jgi:hypothetical protein
MLQEKTLIQHVINKLYFKTNSNTIVPYLKSKAKTGTGHARFTLNSIVDLPKRHILPLNDDIFRLSLLNIGLPILDEKLRAKFIADWTPEYTGKQSKSVLYETVGEIRKKLKLSKSQKHQLEVLEQATDNYEISGFFSQFDWCMDHWGTPEDIQDVTASTFDLPTDFIEFKTLLTPPVIALQQLANTFPSVWFTLLYQYPSEDTWNEVQFYPFPPFGY